MLKILFHVILPILIGGLIYVFFRGRNLVFMTYIELVSNLSLTSLSYYTDPIKTKLYDWVIYSLPDGLWVYSFTSSIMLMKLDSKVRIYIIHMPLLLAVTFEMFQLLDMYKGTFDPIDLLFFVLFFLLSVTFLNPNIIIPLQNKFVRVTKPLI